jgi:hypothetical protein
MRTNSHQPKMNIMKLENLNLAKRHRSLPRFCGELLKKHINNRE